MQTVASAQKAKGLSIVGCACVSQGLWAQSVNAARKAPCLVTASPTMGPRYAADRDSATVASVCVIRPTLDTSMAITASVTITHALASGGSSAGVSDTRPSYIIHAFSNLSFWPLCSRRPRSVWLRRVSLWERLGGTLLQLQYRYRGVRVRGWHSLQRSREMRVWPLRVLHTRSVRGQVWKVPHMWRRLQLCKVRSH